MESRLPREAGGYPEIAERRVPLSLETMPLLLYKAIASRGLTSRTDDSFDDRFATFECGTGGLHRTRCCLWMVRPPLIDMASNAEKERRRIPLEVILLAPGVDELVSDYPRYFVSETHPPKPQSGDANNLGRPKIRKGSREEDGPVVYCAEKPHDIDRGR